MDDNAWSHRTLIVQELLENEDITRMDWPAYFPDLNPIEHLWDALRRRFAARLHHPENTQQLKQMLIEECALLPQEKLHQLALSIRRRRHALGRSRATTPAGNHFITLSARKRRMIFVSQLIADHSVASGRRILASTVRRGLPNSGLYARRPVVCVSLNRRQRRAHLGKRTPFLDQTAMGFCTLYRRVQIHTGERFRTSAQQEGTK
ncbi:uncharacterized protein TNCV_814821 [Trichonephila clavipes]|nr:uncharacterized protein TNCV_814821 [Trichonephila clavipes]